MVTYSTTCPCCKAEARFPVAGWFALKEPIGELIACLAQDGTSERSPYTPLMGLCITPCPACGHKCMIDFQVDVTLYLGFVYEFFTANFDRREDVDDEAYFAEIDEDLTAMAAHEAIDVTCLD